MAASRRIFSRVFFSARAARADDICQSEKSAPAQIFGARRRKNQRCADAPPNPPTARCGPVRARSARSFSIPPQPIESLRARYRRRCAQRRHVAPHSTPSRASQNRNALIRLDKIFDGDYSTTNFDALCRVNRGARRLQKYAAAASEQARSERRPGAAGVRQTARAALRRWTRVRVSTLGRGGNSRRTASPAVSYAAIAADIRRDDFRSARGAQAGSQTRAERTNSPADFCVRAYARRQKKSPPRCVKKCARVDVHTASKRWDFSTLWWRDARACGMRSQKIKMPPASLLAGGIDVRVVRRECMPDYGLASAARNSASSSSLPTSLRYRPS